MAVISRVTYWVLGEEFKRTTSVLASGVFRMKIPKSVQELLRMHHAHVESDTLDACDTAWKKTIKEAEEASSSEKKVILYRLSLNDGTKYQGGDKDFAFGYGYIMGIEVGVFTKRTTQLSGGKKRYKYERSHSRIPSEATGGNFAGGLREDAEYAAGRGEESKVTELPWTEKREEFFTAILVSMRGMMDKLKDLSKPRKLIKLSKLGAPQKLLGDSK